VPNIEENDDDFDEEKNIPGKKQVANNRAVPKSKTPVLDNFGRDITRWLNWAHWIPSLAGN